MEAAKLIAKKKSTKRDGTTPIYVQYSYTRDKRTLIRTGIYLNPKQWDYENSKVRRNVADYKELQEDLNLMLERVNNIVRKAKRENIDPTIEYVSHKFNNPEQKRVISMPAEFFSEFKMFIEESKSRVVNDVIKDYKSCMKHLKGFQQKTGYKVSFDRINYTFYEKWVKYLNYDALQPNGTKGLATSTTGKQIKNLKTFLHNRMRKGIIDQINLDGFVVMQEEVDKIYLSEEEINKIYNLDLSEKPYLSKYRDLFIIGCLTGLRFSDFSNLSPANFKGDYIHKTQEKVSAPVIIPIHDYVKEIIDNYDKHLPKISHQKFNKYIKELGKIAGIDEDIIITRRKGNKKIENTYKKYELICSHTCRRSFCTNEYLKGTPSIYIMKISGHRTEKAFMRYIRIDEKEAAERMMEFWNRKM